MAHVATKPSWYLVSTEDKMIPLDAQRLCPGAPVQRLWRSKAATPCMFRSRKLVAHLIEKAATGALAAAMEKTVK
jgi:hypothetical protein